LGNNFFILTGGPGSGKTALIEEFKNRGFFCMDEVGRKIIQEELTYGAEPLTEEMMKLRIEKMLIRSIETYEEVKDKQETIFFDRGILDYLGFADYTNTLISNELFQASIQLHYHAKVFILPPWEKIYCNDTERKQSFEEAIDVYNFCLTIYTNYGYEIIEIPKIDVSERADFILKVINPSTP